MPKRVRGAADQSVEDAIRDSHQEGRFFVTLVARFVPYSDFCDQVTLDVFRLLLGTALFDQFSELADAEKATRMGSEASPVTAARLAGLREHPLYGALRERIQEQARRLALPRSMDEWAEVAEDVAAREGLKIALTGGVKERIEAVKSIIDRRSAKKGREVAPSFLVLPERFVEALQAGFAATADRPEVADAGRLNVPRLVGRGST